MGIVIKNTKFIVRNAKVRGGDVSPAPQLGSIFRIVNTQTTTDSLTYTNINGQVTSSGNISVGGVKYILALYGSMAERQSTGGNLQLTGSANQLSVMDMLITTTVNQNPSFTEQLITTTGSGSWTKPDGVTTVLVECWGAGGGGGGAITNSGGSGGAAGNYSRKLIQYSSPTSTIPYVVGVGGTSSAGGNGTSGSFTSWNSTSVIATSGAGGRVGVSLDFVNGASNSTGSCVGDVIYAGGWGGGGEYAGGFGSPPTPEALGGSGGGAAGSLGSEQFQAFGGSGRFGVLEFGGEGGAIVGTTAGTVTGNTGSLYGGGGGGGARLTSGANVAGGAGAQGLIRIIYR